jgi:hypothetical protein
MISVPGYGLRHCWIELTCAFRADIRSNCVMHLLGLVVYFMISHMGYQASTKPYERLMIFGRDAG